MDLLVEIPKDYPMILVAICFLLFTIQMLNKIRKCNRASVFFICGIYFIYIYFCIRIL